MEPFSFQYKVYEGCTLCKPQTESIQYLDPSIEVNKEQLFDNIYIENIVKTRSTNYILLA